jgi:hypothetical protein
VLQYSIIPGILRQLYTVHYTRKCPLVPVLQQLPFGRQLGLYYSADLALGSEVFADPLLLFFVDPVTPSVLPALALGLSG